MRAGIYDGVVDDVGYFYDAAAGYGESDWDSDNGYRGIEDVFVDWIRRLLFGGRH